MKRNNCNIPEELTTQIEILSTLQKLILKQKMLIESEDFDNLYTSKSDFDEINDLIQQKREQLSIIENRWDCYQSEISEDTQIRINNLLDQLNDMAEKVLIVENENYDILEISQQKIGEVINEFY